MNSFPAEVGIPGRSVIWHRNGRLFGVLLASTFIDGRNRLLESRESSGQGRLVLSD